MTPKQIILHHSLTKDSQTVSWGAIRKYHKSYAYNGKIISKEEAEYCIASGQHVKKPWKDIGYHFGIELINNSYEILMGRMPNVQGAHCRSHNEDSIGICFVGNYDIDTPSKKMVDKGVLLTTYLCEVYNISSDHIYGHRDYASKTCPGAHFDLDDFKSQVGKILSNRALSGIICEKCKAEIDTKPSSENLGYPRLCDKCLDEKIENIIQVKNIKEARKVFKDAFDKDPDFRYGYQSNIAMLLHDQYGITDHKIRNAAASDIIKLIFE